MGNKKSTPVIEEEKATEWDGNFVDCESVDWGVSEPIPERDNVRTLRATVFGTGGAGKSCLLTKWFCDRFSEEYDPTIENYYRKQLLLGDTIFTLEVLDTAGQEEFVALQESWINDAHIFLLVFSLDDRDSFGYVKHMERKISRLKNGAPYTCVLCGTKKDLARWSDFDPLLYAPGMDGAKLLQKHLHQAADTVVSYLWEPKHVHYAEALAFAREKNFFSYVEASSHSGLNVDKTFRILAHCALVSNQRFASQRKAERIERQGTRRELERKGSKHNLDRSNSRPRGLERSNSKGPHRTSRRVQSIDHSKSTVSSESESSRSNAKSVTSPVSHTRSHSGRA